MIRKLASGEYQGTCPASEARGQVGLDAGRRVRAGGAAPRSRAPARRPLARAGDRDRPVEGPPGGGEAAPAGERQSIGEDAQKRKGGPRGRAPQDREAALGEAVARDREGAEARGQQRRVQHVAGEARALAGAEAPTGRAGRTRPAPLRLCYSPAPGEFWAADERGLHRSDDRGTSWHPVSAFTTSLDHLRGLTLVR